MGVLGQVERIETPLLDGPGQRSGSHVTVGEKGGDAEPHGVQRTSFDGARSLSVRFTGVTLLSAVPGHPRCRCRHTEVARTRVGPRPGPRAIVGAATARETEENPWQSEKKP
jgi:hypothetical protein